MPKILKRYSILLITGECKSNYNEVLPPHPPGFTGGSVVKNLPANAGDTGSIPGPGGSYMPQGNYAHAPQLLKPHALEPAHHS